MTYEIALPKGSLVLVTGANGYIGSHVADQLMAAGYRVRGTARSKDKAQRIAEFLEKRHSKDAFEYAVVADMAAANAFDDAMKDCQGVAHVASDIFSSPNPHEVIPAVVDGTLNILKAAKAHPSVKRVVLTSSSAAAVKAIPNKQFHIPNDSWNEADVEIAYAPPPYKEDRAYDVYVASKVKGEQAAWEFIKTEKPQFVFNAILPNFNCSAKLDPQQSASSAGLIEGVWKGDEMRTTMLQNFIPQHYIDTTDDALLHVAALMYSDVENERLFGFAGPMNYQTILDVFKKIDPSRSFPPALNQDKNLSTCDTSRCVELLKRFGRDGWTPFETSVRELIKSVS